MIHHLNLLTLPVCFVKASSSNHEYWLLVVFMKGHGHSWILKHFESWILASKN